MTFQISRKMSDSRLWLPIILLMINEEQHVAGVNEEKQPRVGAVARAGETVRATSATATGVSQV